MKKIKFDSPNSAYWTVSKAHSELFKHLNISRGKIIKLICQGNIPAFRYRSRYIMNSQTVITYVHSLLDIVQNLHKRYGKKTTQEALLRFEKREEPKSMRMLVNYLEVNKIEK